MRHCVASGADVVVIGDPTAAVIAASAATTILCPVDSPSAFDSLAALFAVVAAIANDVYEASGPAGRAHVDAVARRTTPSGTRRLLTVLQDEPSRAERQWWAWNDLLR